MGQIISFIPEPNLLEGSISALLVNSSEIPSKAAVRALWLRLRSMSGAEIRERAWQEVCKRIDLARYSLNAAPKAGVVPGGAEAQFFFTPEQLPELVSVLRNRLPDQVAEILTRAQKIFAHRFDLLGYEDLDYGLKIDWHMDRVHGKRAPLKPWYKIRYLDFAEVGDVKITWELNRHQQLVTLAKAYGLTKDERFAKEALAQWYDWIEQNPYPIGVNWASSLEIAFRAISWLWLKHLLIGSNIASQKFGNDLQQALWLSGRHIARYLSTYFSANTHLLGEAVGLFFLGVLCPELNMAPEWKKLGWKIILEESERQVRPDGMHFEQSSYYHVYALDLFLHAALLATRNYIEIPQPLERTIEKMLEAVLLTSQAGVSPRFGDDDGGRIFDPQRNCVEHMLDPLATGAVLFGRGDFKAAVGALREETLWLVGAEGIAHFDALAQVERRQHSTAFPNSGLYVMATPGGPAQLVIDGGPQGSLSAGHSHADALSLQVSHGGQEVLVDPGTGEYIGPNHTRNVFRGTAAHNAVQIDGRDQCAPKGPFSWERLITPQVNEWTVSENFDLFAGSCEIDGGDHRRWVFFCKPEFWLMRDVVGGAGKHRVTISWHLAPGMVRHKKDPRLYVSSSTNSGIAIMCAEANWEFDVREGVWSPAYGQKKSAPVLRFEKETALPVEIATVLIPGAKAETLGELACVQDSSQSSHMVSAYSYSAHGEVHRMFFAAGGRTWSLQNWSSDAQFLYAREDPSGVRMIALCNGSQVTFDGRPVLSAKKAIRSCEVTFPDRQIISEQRDIIELGSWPEVETSRLEPATVRSDN